MKMILEEMLSEVFGGTYVKDSRGMRIYLGNLIF